ncbi:MAG: hypothetical protein RL596_2553, partial [Bacteroidota bacterium]
SLANCLANVLLPQEEKPSNVIIILAIIGKYKKSPRQYCQGLHINTSFMKGEPLYQQHVLHHCFGKHSQL